MKARNLDQNIVYFPKVDSERIEKNAVLLRPEIHSLILKGCIFFIITFFFFCKGGKLCCNDKIREFISFIFSPFVQKHFIGIEKAIAN